MPRQVESPLKKLLAVGRWGFLDSGQSWLAYFVPLQFSFKALLSQSL